MQNNRAKRPLDILQWDSRKCFKIQKKARKDNEKNKNRNKLYNGRPKFNHINNNIKC